MKIIKSIQNRIYEIRGERVMLDFDVATLFDINVQLLRLAANKNRKRFPKDLMFQLTELELNLLQNQIETLEKSDPLRLQLVKFKADKNQDLPYAFSAEGIVMLSCILNSDKAVAMNIAITKTYLEVGKISPRDQDSPLNGVFDAIENLIDKNAEQEKWESRSRIGFKLNQ